MEDLWPMDFGGGSNLKAPSVILKEQGLLLGQKTANIVIGEVKRAEPATHDEIGKFSYRFLISCPSFGYSYELFSIIHEVVFYPLTIIIEDNDVRIELHFPPRISKMRIKNEEAFKYQLKRIFNTKKLKTIISSLLAQASK